MGIRYVHIDANRPNLLLPDGRKAAALRLRELRAEMERLKIPGLLPDMGKAALLNRYEKHVFAVAETIRLPEINSAKVAGHLPPEVAQRAAQLIETQAAA